MNSIKHEMLTSHLNCSNASPDKPWSKNFFTATSCGQG